MATIQLQTGIIKKPQSNRHFFLKDTQILIFKDSSFTNDTLLLLEWHQVSVTEVEWTFPVSLLGKVCIELD